MGEGKLTTKVAKWGNSLALHLTKPMIDAIGVKAGDKVDITCRDGAIYIRALTKGPSNG